MNRSKKQHACASAQKSAPAEQSKAGLEIVPADGTAAPHRIR
jgi:hypothetical protein